MSEKYLLVTKRNGKYDTAALLAKRAFEDVFSAITAGTCRRSA